MLPSLSSLPPCTERRLLPPCTESGLTKQIRKGQRNVSRAVFKRLLYLLPIQCTHRLLRQRMHARPAARREHTEHQRRTLSLLYWRVREHTESENEEREDFARSRLAAGLKKDQVELPCDHSSWEARRNYLEHLAR